MDIAANISVGFSQPPRDTLPGGKQDPISSGVTEGSFSQPSGRAVSPFGTEFYEPAFTGISWAFAGGKCTITAKLDTICPWGTNAGGDIDVPSATAAVITAANWRAVSADLKPGAASPFKSPRTTYYSQSLVERHEKFHGTDDLGWTKGPGLGLVKATLEAGSAAPLTAPVDVTLLINAARTKLIAENLKWYKGGGASHDAFAGEIRAYADGRPSYQALSDAVATHGRTLAAPAPAPVPGPLPAAPPAPGP